MFPCFLPSMRIPHTNDSPILFIYIEIVYTFSTKLQAKSVAGSWNQWKPEQMRTTDGVATVSLRIPYGKFMYKFIVIHPATNEPAATNNPGYLGKILELDPGTFFFGRESLGSKLFVRKSYEELAEIIFELLSSGGKVALTGNPGVGKTYFVNYFLYYILTKEKNPTVVVYRHLEERWYLFSQGGTAVIPGKNRGARELDDYLTDPATWYLVDTDQPLERDAKTLLVSSPYSNRYKDFLKLHGHYEIHAYLDPG
jgi:hypothetical protein